MNAPEVWIVLPAMIAGVLFFLRRWRRAAVLAGAFTCLVLAGLAWRFPIAQDVSLGPWTLKLTTTLTVLGRRFVLTDNERPILISVYFFALFWFSAAYIARAGRMFVPFGLGIVSLLIAVLAVEPFLYAALIIEMVVLACIPILSSPGQSSQRGSLRFLIFQTLGMPFILLAGWMLAGSETGPVDQQAVVRIANLLGFGFVLLLAVFPFHSWIPILAKESHPYAVAFVLIFMPWMVSLFALSFLDRFAWLHAAVDSTIVVRLIGVLMIGSGGFWALFERHLGRLLGYGAMLEIGFSFLSIGISGQLPVFFQLLLPRVLAFGVWALSLSAMRQRAPGMRLLDVGGIARSMPIVSFGLLAAHFSTAGMPLLAGFPLHLALLQKLAALSLWQAVLALAGVIGFFSAGLRTLAILVAGQDESDWRITESWQLVFLLSLGILALVMVGLFPHVFLPLFSGIQAFPHLGQ